MDDLFELRITAMKLRKIYDMKCTEIMEKYELRRADVDILWLIYRSGNDKTARAIAETGMSKANISKSIENLKINNLISLETDKSDRRYVHIHLKTAAYAVIDEIIKVKTKINSDLFAGISPEEKEIFKKTRNRLEHNINTQYNF